MLVFSWASIVWAPLIIGVTVWMPRYRWPAAVGVAAIMLTVFGGIYASVRPAPDCEGLEEFEKILCWESNAMASAILGYTIVIMAVAALLASITFFIGSPIRRNSEPRKAAH